MSDMNSEPSPFGGVPHNPWASEGAATHSAQASLTMTGPVAVEPTTHTSERRSWGATVAAAVVALAVGAGAGWFLGDRGSADAPDGVQMYSGESIPGFPDAEIGKVPEALAEGLFYCVEMDVSSFGKNADGVNCEAAVSGYRGKLRYVGSDERAWIDDQLDRRSEQDGFKEVAVEGLEAAEFRARFDNHDNDLTMLTLTDQDRSFYLDVSARDDYGDEPSDSENSGFIRAVEAVLGISGE